MQKHWQHYKSILKVTIRHANSLKLTGFHIGGYLGFQFYLTIYYVYPWFICHHGNICFDFKCINTLILLNSTSQHSLLILILSSSSSWVLIQISLSTTHPLTWTSIRVHIKCKHLQIIIVIVIIIIICNPVSQLPSHIILLLSASSSLPPLYPFPHHQWPIHQPAYMDMSAYNFLLPISSRPDMAALGLWKPSPDHTRVDHHQHCSKVTWVSWCLKSLTTQMFVQQHVQINNQGKITSSALLAFARGIHQ